MGKMHHCYQYANLLFRSVSLPQYTTPKERVENDLSRSHTIDGTVTYTEKKSKTNLNNHGKCAIM